MASPEDRLTDDILVAFADKELSADEMKRLGPLIEADEEASAKVAQYRKSGEELRQYFDVPTPLETPPEIASKIRAMGTGGAATGNVVSLSSYRERISKSFRALSTGRGLQKIAASLFVGVLVGVGGATQYGEFGSIRSGDPKTSQFRGGSNVVQDRYAEAEPRLKHALVIKEKTLGPDHPDVARDLHTLAVLYHKQGRYAEAEHLLKRALAIAEKALGSQHPHVALVLNNLAVLYRNQGRNAEAEPLYKRARAIKEKELGSDHTSIGATVESSAEPYRSSSLKSDMVLLSGNQSFSSGSTVKLALKYRINIEVKKTGRVWLIYHEQNLKPESIISERPVTAGEIVKFPDDNSEGVKFDTSAQFINFEVRTESAGKIDREYFVFGVQ